MAINYVIKNKYFLLNIIMEGNGAIQESLLVLVLEFGGSRLKHYLIVLLVIIKRSIAWLIKICQLLGFGFEPNFKDAPNYFKMCENISRNLFGKKFTLWMYNIWKHERWTFMMNFVHGAVNGDVGDDAGNDVDHDVVMSFVTIMFLEVQLLVEF